MCRREWLAVGAGDAELGPFADWTTVGGAFLCAVDALAEAHFDAPGQAFDPPLLLELLGRRAERVGGRSEEIELAVAIEIDTRAIELRRHELREAHGAGPGAAHFIALENAVLQDAQREHEFLAEQLLPPPDIGLRCEHADHVVA